MQSRLKVLERFSSSTPQGIPVGLNEWSEDEHTAIMKRLKLYSYPILLFMHEDFMSANQTSINAILASSRIEVPDDDL